jgi:hypothetical protein
LRSDIRDVRVDFGKLAERVSGMGVSLASCQSRCYVENESQRMRRSTVAPWVQAVAAWVALAIALLTLVR